MAGQLQTTQAKTWRQLNTVHRRQLQQQQFQQSEQWELQQWQQQHDQLLLQQQQQQLPQQLQDQLPQLLPQHMYAVSNRTDASHRAPSYPTNSTSWGPHRTHSDEVQSQVAMSGCMHSPYPVTVPVSVPVQAAKTGAHAYSNLGPATAGLSGAGMRTASAGLSPDQPIRGGQPLLPMAFAADANNLDAGPDVLDGYFNDLIGLTPIDPDTANSPTAGQPYLETGLSHVLNEVPPVYPAQRQAHICMQQSSGGDVTLDPMLMATELDDGSLAVEAQSMSADMPGTGAIESGTSFLGRQADQRDVCHVQITLMTALVKCLPCCASLSHKGRTQNHARAS